MHDRHVAADSRRLVECAQLVGADEVVQTAAKAVE
jgi:hypothetical protein